MYLKYLKNNRLSILILGLLYLHSIVFAGGEERILGARQAGMGMNSSTLVNIFSTSSNQAVGAYLEKPAVGLYYSTVGLTGGINMMALAAAYPLTTKKKGGTIGVNFQYFGNELYDEKKAGLNYSIKLAEYISIGAQLDILNIRQSSTYGNKTFATFEIGVFARPFKELSVGAHVYNPLRLKIEDQTGEVIPTVFKIGLTYEAFKKFFISAEVAKDLQKSFLFRAGIDYQIIDAFSIRAGVATDPTIVTFGTGFKFKGIRLDLAGSYQSLLGFSPHFGMTYDFGKKKSKK
jgi:hypothetical protein